jgi:transcription-repair coupling factor (superfamily II helicase)
VEDSNGIEAFAAELIDRFGKLPEPTDNLLRLIETKLNAKKACIAKLDVGPKGALVSFHDDKFPNIDGLLAYVERLDGTARLRPDMKLVVSREWANPKARLNAALQISRGLAKAAG